MRTLNRCQYVSTARSLQFYPSIYLTHLVAEKIQQAVPAASKSAGDNGSGMLSPPRFSAQEKAKGRVAHNQLPMPAHTQLSTQRRDHPVPNLQVQRAAQQLSSASSDQQRETRRRDSGSSASQHEKPSIVKQWTHVAKGFGMGVCPWISESDLADALTLEEGQDLPEDHPLHEVVEFLNDWGVKDHERKHPQFLSNVSALLLLALILVNTTE